VFVRKVLAGAIVTVALVIGLYAGYLLVDDNFHTVVRGRLYRSAQPTAELIEAWHAQYGIRTIINLRGAHPKSAWYKIERIMANALHIRLIDFTMSANHDLSTEQANELLNILSKAEGPILIHCKNGADRSGIASAFYVAAVAKGSEFYAELQLTPLYGHFPLWFLPAFSMDRSYEKAEPKLGFPNS
jgi:protein tyrosine/serine phosphatase